MNRKGSKIEEDGPRIHRTERKDKLSKHRNAIFELLEDEDGEDGEDDEDNEDDDDLDCLYDGCM